MGKRTLLIILIGLFSAAWSDTQPSPVVTGNTLPKEYQNVGVDEHLGSSLDLDIPFVDDLGRTVHLSDYFRAGRPVLMAMVYYTCPNLCNYHLNGLTAALKQLKWTAGPDFQIVAVSMNPDEGPKEAAPKKANYIKAYGRPESAEGWHFLTGKQADIKKVADGFGFRYKWIAAEKQFSHTSVSYVLTPDGKISRYIYGIEPDPQTVKLSLLEASSGKIGTVVDQVLLYCFHFDPGKNRYTLYAMNLMRMGGVAVLLLIGLLLIPFWRKERLARR